MTRHDSNRKGNLAEAAVAFHAAKLDIPVFRPLTEHCRYDLVLEIGGQLQRVQCKWCPRRDGVVIVRLTASRYTSGGQQIRTKYTADEVDAVAAYCEELDRCYLLPIELVGGMNAIQLRLSEPRNGQRAALNWAAEYELGAVAQLEVAPAWHAGGRRFESDQLHPPDGNDEVVGANPFRNRFGWYMQRAAAGETFLVTLRGKPYVRLEPALDQPSLPTRLRESTPR